MTKEESEKEGEEVSGLGVNLLRQNELAGPDLKLSPSLESQAFGYHGAGPAEVTAQEHLGSHIQTEECTGHEEAIPKEKKGGENFEGAHLDRSLVDECSLFPFGCEQKVENCRLHSSKMEKEVSLLRERPCSPYRSQHPRTVEIRSIYEPSKVHIDRNSNSVSEQASEISPDSVMPEHFMGHVKDLRKVFEDISHKEKVRHFEVEGKAKLYGSLRQKKRQVTRDIPILPGLHEPVYSQVFNPRSKRLLNKNSEHGTIYNQACIKHSVPTPNSSWHNRVISSENINETAVGTIEVASLSGKIDSHNEYSKLKSQDLHLPLQIATPPPEKTWSNTSFSLGSPKGWRKETHLVRSSKAIIRQTLEKHLQTVSPTQSQNSDTFDFSFARAELCDVMPDSPEPEDLSTEIDSELPSMRYSYDTDIAKPLNKEQFHIALKQDPVQNENIFCLGETKSSLESERDHVDPLTIKKVKLEDPLVDSGQQVKGRSTTDFITKEINLSVSKNNTGKKVTNTLWSDGNTEQNLPCNDRSAASKVHRDFFSSDVHIIQANCRTHNNCSKDTFVPIKKENVGHAQSLAHNDKSNAPISTQQRNVNSSGVHVIPPTNSTHSVEMKRQKYNFEQNNTGNTVPNNRTDGVVDDREVIHLPLEKVRTKGEKTFVKDTMEDYEQFSTSSTDVHHLKGTLRHIYTHHNTSLLNQEEKGIEVNVPANKPTENVIPRQVSTAFFYNKKLQTQNTLEHHYKKTLCTELHSFKISVENVTPQLPKERLASQSQDSPEFSKDHNEFEAEVRSVIDRHGDTIDHGGEIIYKYTECIRQDEYGRDETESAMNTTGDVLLPTESFVNQSKTILIGKGSQTIRNSRDLLDKAKQVASYLATEQTENYREWPDEDIEKHIMHLSGQGGNTVEFEDTILDKHTEHTSVDTSTNKQIEKGFFQAVNEITELSQDTLYNSFDEQDEHDEEEFFTPSETSEENASDHKYEDVIGHIVESLSHVIDSPTFKEELEGNASIQLAEDKIDQTVFNSKTVVLTNRLGGMADTTFINEQQSGEVNIQPCLGKEGLSANYTNTPGKKMHLVTMVEKSLGDVDSIVYVTNTIQEMPSITPIEEESVIGIHIQTSTDKIENADNIINASDRGIIASTKEDNIIPEEGEPETNVIINLTEANIDKTSGISNKNHNIVNKSDMIVSVPTQKEPISESVIPLVLDKIDQSGYDTYILGDISFQPAKDKTEKTPIIIKIPDDVTSINYLTDKKPIAPMEEEPTGHAIVCPKETKISQDIRFSGDGNMINQFASTKDMTDETEQSFNIVNIFEVIGSTKKNTLNVTVTERPAGHTFVYPDEDKLHQPDCVTGKVLDIPSMQEEPAKDEDIKLGLDKADQSAYYTKVQDNASFQHATEKTEQAPNIIKIPDDATSINYLLDITSIAPMEEEPPEHAIVCPKEDKIIQDLRCNKDGNIVNQFASTKEITAGDVGTQLPLSKVDQLLQSVNTPEGSPSQDITYDKEHTISIINTSKDYPHIVSIETITKLHEEPEGNVTIHSSEADIDQAADYSIQTDDMINQFSDVSVLVFTQREPQIDADVEPVYITNTLDNVDIHHYTDKTEQSTNISNIVENFTVITSTKKNILNVIVEERPAGHTIVCPDEDKLHQPDSVIQNVLDTSPMREEPTRDVDITVDLDKVNQSAYDTEVLGHTSFQQATEKTHTIIKILDDVSSINYLADKTHIAPMQKEQTGHTIVCPKENKISQDISCNEDGNTVNQFASTKEMTAGDADILPTLSKETKAVMTKMDETPEGNVTIHPSEADIEQATYYSIQTDDIINQFGDVAVLVLTQRKPQSDADVEPVYITNTSDDVEIQHSTDKTEQSTNIVSIVENFTVIASTKKNTLNVIVEERPAGHTIVCLDEDKIDQSAGEANQPNSVTEPVRDVDIKLDLDKSDHSAFLTNVLDGAMIHPDNTKQAVNRKILESTTINASIEDTTVIAPNMENTTKNDLTYRSKDEKDQMASVCIQPVGLVKIHTNGATTGDTNIKPAGDEINQRVHFTDASDNLMIKVSSEEDILQNAKTQPEVVYQAADMTIMVPAKTESAEHEIGVKTLGSAEIQNKENSAFLNIRSFQESTKRRPKESEKHNVYNSHIEDAGIFSSIVDSVHISTANSNIMDSVDHQGTTEDINVNLIYNDSALSMTKSEKLYQYTTGFTDSLSETRSSHAIQVPVEVLKIVPSVKEDNLHENTINSRHEFQACLEKGEAQTIIVDDKSGYFSKMDEEVEINENMMVWMNKLRQLETPDIMKYPRGPRQPRSSPLSMYSNLPTIKEDQDNLDNEPNNVMSQMQRENEEALPSPGSKSLETETKIIEEQSEKKYSWEKNIEMPSDKASPLEMMRKHSGDETSRSETYKALIAQNLNSRQGSIIGSLLANRVDKTTEKTDGKFYSRLNSSFLLSSYITPKNKSEETEEDVHTVSQDMPTIKDSDVLMPATKDSNPNVLVSATKDRNPNILVPTTNDSNPNVLVPATKDSNPNVFVPATKNNNPNILVPATKDSIPDVLVPATKDSNQGALVSATKDSNPLSEKVPLSALGNTSIASSEQPQDAGIDCTSLLATVASSSSPSDILSEPHKPITTPFKDLLDIWHHIEKPHGQLNPRPGKIIIFSEPEFKGQTHEIYSDVGNTSGWELPDSISVRVVRGGWLLYEKPLFRGKRLMLLEGDTDLTCPWNIQKKTNKEDTNGHNSWIGSLRHVVKDFQVPQISLFPEQNGEGEKVKIVGPAPDTHAFGQPIKTESIIVHSGLWLLYSKPFFEGDPYILESGGYPNRKSWGGLDSHLCSLQPARIGGPTVEKPNEPKLHIFQYPAFEGHMWEVTRDLHSVQVELLTNVGSLKILGGCWVGYEKEGFRGHQYLLEEGEFRNWSHWGGRTEELGSLRLIRTDFSEPEIVLYEDPGCSEGPCLRLNEALADIEVAQYRSKTGSIHVLSGVWVAYENVDFSGEQYILEKGTYHSYQDWGAENSTICSLQPVLQLGGQNLHYVSKIQLFSEPNFHGGCLICTGDHILLPETFSPESCRVEGGSWILYEGEDCTGEQYVLSEGEYPTRTAMGCLTVCVLRSLRKVPFYFSVPSISLHGLERFEGKELEFSVEIRSLQGEGYNNHVLSVRVESGIWVLYEHSDFRGRQWLLEKTQIPNWLLYSGLQRVGSLCPIRQRRVYIRIRNRALNLFLSVPEQAEDMKAARVLVTEPKEGSCELWYYEDGHIKNQIAPHMSLQVVGKPGPGTKVVLWAEGRKPVQTWSLQDSGYIISHTFQGMCIDVKGGNSYDSDHVVVWEMEEDRCTQHWDVEVF